jgi:hypothetical protein
MADPVAFEAQLRLKIEAEMLAKQTTEQTDEEKSLASIPETLVGTSSKGGIQSTEWTGPTSLESVIG